MTIILWTIWAIVGSSIYLWIIAMLFSAIKKDEFRYRGNIRHTPNLIFQITSKECLETVKRGVNSVVASCYEVGFTNYEIWVVTENQNPLTIQEGKTRVVVVPEEFKCKGIYKARALEYARRQRVKEEFDGWIYFLDEENWITAQTVSAITSFANRSTSKLASGPLAFCSGRSKFASLGDSVRVSESRVCHLGHSLGWWPLHGENLLVHAEVEEKVGWQFTGLTEDHLFAAHAGRIGYRTGWHGGELYTISPSSLIDFLKQRRRWFRGMLQFVVSKDIKFKYRILELYLLLVSLLGIVFIASIVAFLAYDFGSTLASRLYLYPALAIFPCAYLVGAGRKVKDGVLAVLLSWVFGGLESIAAWLSLLKPPKGFDIIKKT